MAENTDVRIAAQVVDVDLRDEARECAYTYGMSVNISRALPDVRDGCKPVHRRILTIMHERDLKPGGDFIKSAKIVGDVIGSLHPHGDAAVYLTMVRMAQDHALRYPLVDGQGSFGDVDGNPPAAMRYTEVRWSRIGVEMVRDLDCDTVDLIGNYDQSRMEPKVLPARFPNLLCNGTAGIGWAMQTNIAPHNLSEIVDLGVALIDNPALSDEEILSIVSGPDFPTGGLIIGRDGVRSAYLTGRGSITMRGEVTVEEDRRAKRIVITSIPYGVNKSVLISKITELVLENQKARKSRDGRSLIREFDDILDVRDESDRSGMRIVIECSRNAFIPGILQVLYQKTPLQENFAYNAVALVDGKPKANLTLRELMTHYLNHQKDVVIRKARFERAALAKKLHTQLAFWAAVSQLDATIRLIREHRGTKAELLPRLMALLTVDGQPIDREQAERIADMPLYRISALERSNLEAEIAELRAGIAHLDAFVADERQVWRQVRRDLLDLKKRFGDERRTRIVEEVPEVRKEDLIKPEEMVITLTLGGTVKRTALSAFRTQRRKGTGSSGHAVRGDDQVADILIGNTRDDVFFFTASGRVLKRLVWDIPEADRDGRGRSVSAFLGLDPDDRVVKMLPLASANPEHFLVMVTAGGKVLRTRLGGFLESTRIAGSGIKALTTEPGDQVVEVQVAGGGRHPAPGNAAGQVHPLPARGRAGVRTRRKGREGAEPQRRRPGDRRHCAAGGQDGALHQRAGVGQAHSDRGVCPAEPRRRREEAGAVRPADRTAGGDARGRRRGRCGGRDAEGRHHPLPCHRGAGAQPGNPGQPADERPRWRQRGRWRICPGGGMSKKRLGCAACPSLFLGSPAGGRLDFFWVELTFVARRKRALVR